MQNSCHTGHCWLGRERPRCLFYFRAGCRLDLLAAACRHCPIETREPLTSQEARDGLDLPSASGNFAFIAFSTPTVFSPENRNGSKMVAYTGHFIFLEDMAWFHSSCVSLYRSWRTGMNSLLSVSSSPSSVLRSWADFETGDFSGPVLGTQMQSNSSC